MDADGALLLLREILTDLPQLSGAACVGRHALYDELPGAAPSNASASSGPPRAAVGVLYGSSAPRWSPSSRSATPSR
jgi:hypothetical protein